MRDLGEKLDDFIRHIGVEKNYAENTQAAYRRDLKDFFAFLKTIKIDNLDDLDGENIEHWVMKKRASGLANSTIRRRLCAVRQFLNFLTAQNLVKKNVALPVKTPKPERKLPKILDNYLVEKLIEVRADNFAERRDGAIIATIYSAGLRLREATALNIADVDFDGGFLKISGKGAKIRYAPVGKNALSMIENYRQTRKWCAHPALFINKKCKRVDPRTVQLMIKKRALEVGIEFSVHPHMLRHASATHFLRSSHDLRAVQEFLGHKSIKSTQVYTHLDFLALAKIYDRCHPRAKK